MRHLIILMLLGMSVAISAQQEKKVVIKKEKVVTVNNDSNSEKTVDVSIDEDNGERTITIRSEENGEETMMKWKDNGEIPDDIKRQLKESGIDVQVIDGGDAVFIGESGNEHKLKKKVIVIEDSGEDTMEMEWDGEGEMPAEMKKLMEEHEIDLGEIRRGAKGKKMKMRMLKMDREQRHPHGMHMKRKGGSNSWVEKPVSKTYMGAQIGTGENGTEVLDVMVDSPAHKAGLKKGDLITEINGANTKNVDDTMKLLSLFDVNDTIEVSYTRDGKSKSTKLKLAERPEPYR